MLLLATVIGLSLVVASGCVLNNCIDRDIDRHMERTRGRVTVTGQISLKAALAHGLVLGVAGFGLLWWRTNPLTTALAGFGYFVSSACTACGSSVVRSTARWSAASPGRCRRWSATAR